MRYFRDYVLVKVESDFNDKLAELKGPGGEKIDLVLDTSFDPYKHVTIHGTVLSGPVSFSPNLFLHDNYPGVPYPSVFKDGDYCREQVEKIPEYQITKRRKVKNLAYRPGTFSPGFTSYRDRIKPELRPGDTVYFHYLTVHDSNLVRKNDDGSKVYQVRYDSIFGYKRGEKLKPIGGYVFVKQVFEKFEALEVSGKKVDAAVGKSGLVSAVTNHPLPNQGILIHRGDPVMYKKKAFLDRYSRVLFLDGSEFINRIDGKDYMVMREWDLVGTFDEDNRVVPINEYCLIKLEKQESVSKTGLQIVRFDDTHLQEGKVLQTGRQVNKEHVESGNYVVFAKTRSRLDLKPLNITDGEDLCLVHWKDILYKKFHREYFDNLREVYDVLDRTFEKLKETKPNGYQLPDDERVYWQEECMKAVRILAQRTDEHKHGIRPASKDEIRELDSLKNKAWRMYFFFEYGMEEHLLNENRHL